MFLAKGSNPVGPGSSPEHVIAESSTEGFPHQWLQQPRAHLALTLGDRYQLARITFPTEVDSSMGLLLTAAVFQSDPSQYIQGDIFGAYFEQALETATYRTDLVLPDRDQLQFFIANRIYNIWTQHATTSLSQESVTTFFSLSNSQRIVLNRTASVVMEYIYRQIRAGEMIDNHEDHIGRLIYDSIFTSRSADSGGRIYERVNLPPYDAVLDHDRETFKQMAREVFYLLDRIRDDPESVGVNRDRVISRVIHALFPINNGRSGLNMDIERRMARSIEQSLAQEIQEGAIQYVTSEYILDRAIEVFSQEFETDQVNLLEARERLNQGLYHEVLLRSTKARQLLIPEYSQGNIAPTREQWRDIHRYNSGPIGFRSRRDFIQSIENNGVLQSVTIERLRELSNADDVVLGRAVLVCINRRHEVSNLISLRDFLTQNQVSMQRSSIFGLMLNQLEDSPPLPGMFTYDVADMGFLLYEIREGTNLVVLPTDRGVVVYDMPIIEQDPFVADPIPLRISQDQVSNVSLERRDLLQRFERIKTEADQALRDVAQSGSDIGYFLEEIDNLQRFIDQRFEQVSSPSDQVVGRLEADVAYLESELQILQVIYTNDISSALTEVLTSSDTRRNLTLIASQMDMLLREIILERIDHAAGRIVPELRTQLRSHEELQRIQRDAVSRMQTGVAVLDAMDMAIADAEQRGVFNNQFSEQDRIEFRERLQDRENRERFSERLLDSARRRAP